MKRTSPSSKASRIRARLLSQFPDGRVPRGVANELSAEFGVTKQFISLILHNKTSKDDHFEIVPSFSPIRFLCGVCGEREVARNTRDKTCAECAWIELPCTDCGAAVRRRITHYVWELQKKQPNNLPDGKTAFYTGRVFCNRRCFGHWLGTHYGGGGGRHEGRAPTISQPEMKLMIRDRRKGATWDELANRYDRIPGTIRSAMLRSTGGIDPMKKVTV